MAKYNLLVPLAGRGSRMHSDVPKAMIMAGDRTILEWGMESIDYSECDIIFVILEEQAHNHGLDVFLKAKYPGCSIFTIPSITRGAVETCMQAEAQINSQKPLIIFCPDVAFLPRWKPEPADFAVAGKIMTFKANSPNYSYIQRHPQSDCVQYTREKVVISQEAAVGVYCFQSGKLFLTYAQDMLDGGIQDAGEFFICPLYNLLIAAGLPVHAWMEEAVYIMGTSEELAFFNKAVYPYLDGPKEWVLCSDHSGYWTKGLFANNLESRNRAWLDVGCYSDKDCDYYDFLKLATQRVLANPGSVGVGFCRSGQGMNIAANKIAGIRSALVRDLHEAQLAVQHNAANFFAVPEGADVDNIIFAIKEARFQGGRHQNRLQKIGL